MRWTAYVCDNQNDRATACHYVVILHNTGWGSRPSAVAPGLADARDSSQHLAVSLSYDNMMLTSQ
jgi:hypothetical protein